MTASGRVGENTQTAYALALQFDLLPEELRAEAARRLAAEVKTRGHLTTGFVGHAVSLPRAEPLRLHWTSPTSC